jgi:hypothetical protein
MRAYCSQRRLQAARIVRLQMSISSSPMPLARQLRPHITLVGHWSASTLTTCRRPAAILRWSYRSERPCPLLQLLLQLAHSSRRHHPPPTLETEAQADGRQGSGRKVGSTFRDRRGSLRRSADTVLKWRPQSLRRLAMSAYDDSVRGVMHWHVSCGE